MPRSPRSFRLAGTVLSLAISAGVLAILSADQGGKSICVTPGPTFEGTAAPHGSAPQRARSRERGMYVSAVNRDGVPVTDLSAREFVVREDGVAREVLMAEKADDPITIAILVDNSQAAAPVVSDIRRALKTFVERMGGRNPMALTTFADRPTIVQDYTLVVPQLIRGVERIFPASGSGAYLLQALQDVSTGFAKRDFDRGLMLVITTEGPEFSELNDDQVLPPLRQSGAALDVVVFQAASPPDLGDPGIRNRALVLDQGPLITGGRRVTLLSSLSLDAALEKLATQRTNEYRLTYARPESLIPPEKIEVSVTRPGVDARGTPIRSERG